MQLPSKPNADEHDELTKQRMRMVEKQLIKRGISDQRILHAMSIVPRHEFIPAEWHRAAYRDSALSIDCGQTISQPYTVAFMCQVARLKGNENTLEVGTGSGYGAAVLAKLVKQVHTVERIPQLAHQAQCSLQSLGYNNIDCTLQMALKDCRCMVPTMQSLSQLQLPVFPKHLLPN